MKKLFLLIVAFSLLVIGNTFAQDTLPPQDLADPDGAFVTLDGIEFYYVALGDEDAPTVIMLHGFGGSTFTWRDNMAGLVEAGYRVVAYDRPPFGLSDKTANLDLTPSAQASQAIDLMNALGINTATFIGHSAGGGVISYILAQYPERVDAAVFVAGAVIVPSNDTDTPSEEGRSGGSPIGGIADMAANLDPNSPIAQRLVRQFLTPERFVGILVSAYHPSFEITDDIREGYARVLRVQNWEAGLISLFQAREAGIPMDFDALAQFDKPVLIIWGEEDTWVTIARGRAIHRFFPQSQLITYPNVGHMPMEEATEQFNADILAFVQSVYND